MSTRASSSALALYIGVVQFFFAVTWILYVIYLPQLAAQAGIGREWIPWIVVADQLIFAAMDVATGFWVDRVRRSVARLGGWILGVTVVSCVAFIALPYVGASAAALLGAIVLWSVTSSALRAPPWALLSRHAAPPSLPWLATLVLAGGALAAAAGPYLGIALRGVDPRLPFALSTLTLLAAVGGLVYAERRAGVGPVESRRESERHESPKKQIPFFAALLLMATGYQVHFALNSAPRYLGVATAADLQYLMPVFWIGFNLVMIPGAWLVRRLGADQALAIAAALGAMAMLATLVAGDLAPLAAAQLVAGGCWGAASVAAYTAVIAMGRGGREGTYLGLLFSVLALAALVRIAAYASDLVLDAQIKALLPWLPQAAWLLAAVLLLLAPPARVAPAAGAL